MVGKPRAFLHPSRFGQPKKVKIASLDYDIDDDYEKIKHFFGEESDISPRLNWKRRKSDDLAVFVSGNVIWWGSESIWALFVGNHSFIRLKGRQMMPIHMYRNGRYVFSWAIRLRRSEFVPEATRYQSVRYVFERDWTFDDILALADAQDMAEWHSPRPTWLFGHVRTKRVKGERENHLEEANEETGDVEVEKSVDVAERILSVSLKTAPLY